MNFYHACFYQPCLFPLPTIYGGTQFKKVKSCLKEIYLDPPSLHTFQFLCHFLNVKLLSQRLSNIEYSNQTRSTSMQITNWQRSHIKTLCHAIEAARTLACKREIGQRKMRRNFRVLLEKQHAAPNPYLCSHICFMFSLYDGAWSGGTRHGASGERRPEQRRSSDCSHYWNCDGKRANKHAHIPKRVEQKCSS